MSEFFNVLPPDEARVLLFENVHHRTGPEAIQTVKASGRVTAKAIMAPHPLPTFRRSTMDGYAVRASDTHGASESLPALLAVVGEVSMGQPAHIVLQTGEAVVVHTGGMIPDAADAVVPVEWTQLLGGEHDEIEVLRAVATGQNVLQIGEDVGVHTQVLPAGHRLRPQDLGGLLALGITELEVYSRPEVAIISSGDEVVSPDADVGPGQIRDINSYTIAAQAANAGGIPRLRGIAPDDFAALHEAAAAALADHDMLVMTAGSSVSARDVTAGVIARLGEPGVLLHGVATRPGKPTILGAVEGKPVLGLPGNPVSAMVQFDMFGVPAVQRLQGLEQSPWERLVWARLQQNLPSETGREDYVPARLFRGKEGLECEPVFGKSNLIYTLVNADGLIKVPLNRGGIPAGEWVEVHLF